MLMITYMYSCHALVICVGLLLFSFAVKMNDFVDVIATEAGRIHGSSMVYWGDEN